MSQGGEDALELMRQVGRSAHKEYDCPVTDEIIGQSDEQRRNGWKRRGRGGKREEERKTQHNDARD